jgi:hypothetical protein
VGHGGISDRTTRSCDEIGDLANRQPPSWLRRIVLRRPSLSATPHLWPSIETALGQSRLLILLASLEAVAKEVEYWLEHKSPDRLFIGLTDGELAWDGAAIKSRHLTSLTYNAYSTNAYSTLGGQSNADTSYGLFGAGQKGLAEALRAKAGI